MTSAGVFQAASRSWLTAGGEATRAYAAALQAPRAAQSQVLSRLLAVNADSEYGRRYGFARIPGTREFQAAVPVVSYEDLAPEIERIRNGEPGVLTAEQVVAVELTGGSSAAAKYIPYTRSLKAEFAAAVAPWMADLYHHVPTLHLGGHYWSVSPLARRPEQTAGGIPIGFEADADYFDREAQRALAVLLLAPQEIARAPDIETCRYLTLRFLLPQSPLAFVSVWNPSFLTLLLDSFAPHAEALLHDLETGALTPPSRLPPPVHAALAARLRPEPERAARLRALLRPDGALPWTAVWPGLAVVSCWADAAASRFVPELQQRLPGVAIQGKGLLATEGVVTLPLWGYPGAAPALTSHFLEFAPAGDPGERPALVEDLEAGAEYEVLLTTGGGLYRYRLGDRVRVAARLGPTPLLEFVGRSSAVSDLCGEKLHEQFVQQVTERVLAHVGAPISFAMVAPEWGRPPAYVLFLEAGECGRPGAAMAPLHSVDAALAQALDAELCASPHYAYCRRLGQLGPVRVVRVREGSRRYLDRCVVLGQRAGDVKPAALHRQTGWVAWFARAGEDA